MNKTVKEIHEKRSILYDSSIANHAQYIDKTTGLFSEKFVKSRNCPVCQNNDYLKIFTKEGGVYVKCRVCTMVYLNPIFTDSALTSYYMNNHAIQSDIVENDQEFYLSIYNNGLKSIENQISRKNKVLDIGCSSGVFLDLAKKNNWSTSGIELNSVEAKYAQEKGHEVYNDLLENISFNTEFDAITMWDVFEHLTDGEFYLNLMKRLLTKNGIIFLQIPTSDSLAAKILREKCNMFDGLEHVNLYGVKTINLLANKCGLKVIDIQTVISEIGVINNYLNYEDPYLGDTQNKTAIPNVLDEAEIHKTLQGYKLQVVLGVIDESL